jgi:hypothetical protein
MRWVPIRLADGEGEKNRARIIFSEFGNVVNGLLMRTSNLFAEKEKGANGKWVRMHPLFRTQFESD